MKFINKYTYHLVFLFLLVSGVLLIYKYQNRNSDPYNRLLSLNDTIQQELVGKLIEYPEELYPINIEYSIPEYLSTINTTYLLNFVDADCSSCIEDLKTWEKYLQTHTDYPVIFILTGSDKYNTDYLINDVLQFSYPTYYDSQELFDRYNIVSYYKAYRTFYIKNNEILKVGSPLLLDGLISKKN